MAGIVEPSQPLKREDLGDKLIIIDARKTPMLATLPKGGSVKNTLFEIPLDDYAEPNTDGTPDGTPVTAFDNKAENRTKTGCRLQWFRKRTWRVGHVAQNVSDVAGVSDEIANAKAKCVVEMKRDIEAAIGSSDDSSADTGASGSKTRGLGSWIQTGAQTDQPVPSNYRATSGQISTTAMASTKDSTIRGILKTIASQSGSSDGFMGYCGDTYKETVSDLAKYDTASSPTVAIRTFNQNKESAMIHDVVDIYKSDFGTVTFMLDYFLGYSGGTQTNGDTLCYYVNNDYIELRQNQKPQMVELPEDGGGRNGYGTAMMALCVTSPQAHGKHAATS